MLDLLLNYYAQLSQNQVFVGLFGATLSGGLLWLVRNLPTQLANKIKSIISVQMVLYTTDSCFSEACIWLSKNQKLLRDYRVTYGPRLVSGYGRGFAWYNGRLVTTSKSLVTTQDSSTKEVVELRFYFTNQAMLDSFVAMLKELGDETEGKLVVYRAQSDWFERRLLTKRSKHTLFLPGNQYESLEQDITAFFRSKDEYERRGIPFRRGYLLHGPPGTGKTTLVRVLASELNLPIYVIGASQLLAEQTLYQCFTQARTPCIILLEDIDTYQQTLKRNTDSDKELKKDDTKATPPLSILLNILDGVLSAEGYVFIATTNYPERLDAALKRPGRIDREVHVDLIGAAEIARMVEHYYNTTLSQCVEQLGSLRMTPAAVQTTLQASATPQDALDALIRKKEAHV